MIEKRLHTRPVPQGLRDIPSLPLSAALALAGLLSVACGDDPSATAAAGAGGAAGSASGGTTTGGAATGGGGVTFGGAAGSAGASGGAASAGAAGNGASGFTRYDPSAHSSPVSDSVLASARQIALADPNANDDVFMKVGASGTVSKSFLYCFAGDAQPSYRVEGADDLLQSIEFFRSGDAAGTTPFDRPTLAAVVGRSASWAISGSPSPLEQEQALLHPRFAFVNYGTNDMGLGATYLSALFPFFRNLSTLLDQLAEQGVVSVISGLNPRGDSSSAALWVPTYDAVTRGLAESRQLPYLSLYLASKDLPNQGLLSDGLHGNAFSDGGSQPCVFTDTALQYNYNVRNLLSMSALDRLKRGVVDGSPAQDVTPAGYVGSGSASDPIRIDRLPFTHAGNTSGAERRIDTYTGCGADQDESGPEVFYSLELSERTPLRLLLLDRDGVDVDLHLLSASDGASCLARNDRALQMTLDPGSYLITADTFVTSASEQAGDYLLVVLRCEAGDPDCD
ncbi:MAG: SGNH/GDSL hydrolase family protein [Polyangiaceae bacterium]|nr:SGNH/GDSL hydrolase family protein [Myxococcales bacterium]MCB9584350.1 SGNH/GDSL hydrolase family protein [Polyangiaceae bacterium]